MKLRIEQRSPWHSDNQRAPARDILTGENGVRRRASVGRMRSPWVRGLRLAAILGLPVLPLRASAQRTGNPPVLTVFAIEGAATSVSPDRDALYLTHTVVGLRPSEYRVSARADFAGASWLPYLEPLRAKPWLHHAIPGCDSSSAERVLHLFLQVRVSLGNGVRVVDGQRVVTAVHAESNVMTDSICVSPGPGRRRWPGRGRADGGALTLRPNRATK
jgi:hypothetical protein